MLGLRCQIDTHIIYKSLQSRTQGWDRNTHQEVTGINLVFKVKEIDELQEKESSQRRGEVACLQAVEEGSARDGE